MGSYYFICFIIVGVLHKIAGLNIYESNPNRNSIYGHALTWLADYVPAFRSAHFKQQNVYNKEETTYTSTSGTDHFKNDTLVNVEELSNSTLNSFISPHFKQPNVPLKNESESGSNFRSAHFEPTNFNTYGPERKTENESNSTSNIISTYFKQTNNIVSSEETNGLSGFRSAHFKPANVNNKNESNSTHSFVSAHFRKMNFTSEGDMPNSTSNFISPHFKHSTATVYQAITPVPNFRSAHFKSLNGTMKKEEEIKNFKPEITIPETFQEKELYEQKEFLGRVSTAITIVDTVNTSQIQIQEESGLALINLLRRLNNSEHFKVREVNNETVYKSNNDQVTLRQEGETTVITEEPIGERNATTAKCPLFELLEGVAEFGKGIITFIALGTEEEEE